MSLGFYRGNKNALLNDAYRVAQVADIDRIAKINMKPETHVSDPPATEPAPLSTFSPGPTKDQRQEAQQRGYTGDQCANCNSMKMRISGHCYVCDDCGTTTGCS